MKIFPTLAAFQKDKAEIMGRITITNIRHPELHPDLDAGYVAAKAVHYIRCIWCLACEEEWEKFETQMAAIAETQQFLSEVQA